VRFFNLGPAVETIAFLKCPQFVSGVERLTFSLTQAISGELASETSVAPFRHGGLHITLRFRLDKSRYSGKPYFVLKKTHCHDGKALAAFGNGKIIRKTG